LIESGRPVLAVLTKADKLGRAAQRESVRAIGGALGLPEDQVQLTSARTGLGIRDLGESILALVG
jgi:GTP-binding protein EngB required for normal cell division